jgi:TRAP-type C4-dicarboxylate transport system permease small subunit
MKLFDWLDRALLLVAVLALVVMMLLTTTSVLARYFFNAPIPDDLVLSESLMVFVAFLPLSYVQARREHVFVTLFTDWMSNRSKVLMEMVGVIIGFVIFSIIAAAVYTHFSEALEVGSYNEGQLEVPEWPARFIVFFGLAIFAVRLLVDAVVAIIGVVTGSAVAARSEAEIALEKEV